MARFCSLFSGSDGNCTFVSAGSTNILIDAGVSTKRIEEALSSRDIDPSSIQAIFVTHEHSDHISGIRVFQKRYGCQIFATEGTLKGMEKSVPINDSFCCINIHPILPYGDLEIEWFHTPHDTNQSCDYIIRTPDDRKIAVCTDLGHITGEIKQKLRTCDFVLLESNHDIKMLKAGPYPPPLQERILGPKGHLSNDTCATLLPELVQSGVTQIKLGHISKHNNLFSLAEKTAVDALTNAGCILNEDYRLSLAKPISNDPITYL